MLRPSTFGADTSMDLSSREELRELSRTLEPVARQADRLGLRWILIGAAGRDLILASAGLGPATRATLDVDIAVLVASWAEFDELRAALEKNERASADPSAKQRMYLAHGATLDLVPFGGIELEGRIEWPPKSDPVLEVRALIEAESHSVAVTLPAGVQVRLPTPEVFICLKLLAWRDRHHHKPHHDSVDLADLVGDADEFVGMEEMYDRHQAVLERHDYDLQLASLRSSVRDSATSCSSGTVSSSSNSWPARPTSRETSASSGNWARD